MDDDLLHHPVSPVPQEAVVEPMEETTPPGSSIFSPASTLQMPFRESFATSTTSAIKKLQPKRNPSAANSPLTSRESSPSRPPPKSNSSTRSTAGPGRSRKNSVQDPSPSRAASTPSNNPPSAAATQRALSLVTTPTLRPVAADTSIKAPIPQKPVVTSEIREAPRWPVSPRLRSPPPFNKQSVLSPRKPEQDGPAAHVQKTLPAEQPEGTVPKDPEGDDSTSLPSGMRTPARGPSGAAPPTLETVQEISQPSTPGVSLDGILERNGGHGTASQVTDQENPIDNALGKSAKAKTSTESGSDSGGKIEIKMRSVAQPAALRPPPGKAHSTHNNVRGKPSGEGSTKNMTVETETVSSIPQVALGGPAGGNNGTIRAKPSTETIRPKKEKKKTSRKTPSVTSGTASSKADIFEAQVASAVDEVDSSDSEETFVYESNPPDTNDRPRRFHSRTPSTTSMASQVDQRNGVRPFMDSGHSVAMKKSMKFANSFHSDRPEPLPGDDDGKGTARSNVGTARGTTHHHHVPRWARNGGNGHPSLFDSESPFPNASKSKHNLGGNAPRHGRPTSPRVSNTTRMAGYGKKPSSISAVYDLDDGADDERTPLMGTVRSNRSGRNRRPAASSMRQLEHQASRREKSLMSRFAGCLALTVMIIAVISGAVGFMFTTTQALTDVKILALRNVLASDQDIIFDMQVQARNSNLMAVVIDTTDLVIFAKSKYAGTDHEYWKLPHSTMKRGRRGPRGQENGARQPDNGDPTSPNLEIGHVYELYSPLTFEGSPFKSKNSTSVGQIRVDHPGNQTTPAGSERWGNVVQHEFELLVRGTLKYSLPLSQTIRKLSVEGRAMVKPNAADTDPDLHITL